MTAADRKLAKLDRSLGGTPLRRPYTSAERAALVSQAEKVIDNNWGTDLHETVSMWLAAQLGELELV